MHIAHTHKHVLILFDLEWSEILVANPNPTSFFLSVPRAESIRYGLIEYLSFPGHYQGSNGLNTVNTNFSLYFVMYPLWLIIGRTLSRMFWGLSILSAILKSLGCSLGTSNPSWHVLELSRCKNYTTFGICNLSIHIKRIHIFLSFPSVADVKTLTVEQLFWSCGFIWNARAVARQRTN